MFPKYLGVAFKQKQPDKLHKRLVLLNILRAMIRWDLLAWLGLARF